MPRPGSCSAISAAAGHEARAGELVDEHLAEGPKADEDAAARRQFVLTWVQPGLAGLMDGSSSTLASIFATAFATQNPWTTFLVGLSASVGAGISMGFTEAAHDDGKLGRGSPWKRGLPPGVMTTLGGLGYALPYLIPSFWTATAIALVVVFIELWAIVWIQNRYMEIAFRPRHLPGRARRRIGARRRHPDRRRLRPSSDVSTKCRIADRAGKGARRSNLLHPRWGECYARRGSVAQWLELAAHNSAGAGSSPARPTNLLPLR